MLAMRDRRYGMPQLKVYVFPKAERYTFKKTQEPKYSTTMSCHSFSSANLEQNVSTQRAREEALWKAFELVLITSKTVKDSFPD